MPLLCDTVLLIQSKTEITVSHLSERFTWNSVTRCPYSKITLSTWNILSWLRTQQKTCHFKGVERRKKDKAAGFWHNSSLMISTFLGCGYVRVRFNSFLSLREFTYPSLALTLFSSSNIFSPWNLFCQAFYSVPERYPDLSL